MYILHNNKNRFTNSIEITIKIVLLSCLGLLFFPATFIVWAFSNRDNVRMWLMVIICLLPTIIPIQYSTLFYLSIKSITYVHLIKIFIMFGAFITIFFVASRIISSKIVNTNKRYGISIVVFILLSCLYLTPIGLLHAYSKTITHNIYLIEIETLLWIICVTYIFARFPEDEFIAKIAKYLSNVVKK